MINLLKTPIAYNSKELHNVGIKLTAVENDLSRLTDKKVEVAIVPTPVTIVSQGDLTMNTSFNFLGKYEILNS